MSRPEVRGLRLTGLRPSPTRHVLVLALVGAPAGRGCDRDRRTDPVYEPPLAVSWPAGRPSDLTGARDDHSAQCWAAPRFPDRLIGGFYAAVCRFKYPL